MGINHPECPNRLEVISQALQQASIASQLTWKEAPLATKDHLRRVHDPEYIEFIFSQSPKEGYVLLDPDTMMNPFTLSAALRASGAQIAAVDEIWAGNTKRAFCLVRPPGHHAELGEAMGFSFFNNIAVGVHHAFSTYHCQRIAIVDFDVHHGNGTESMFMRDPRVCFWSCFQHPFYPGTVLSGKPSHIHLCPLAAGTQSEIFRQKVDLELIPILKNFKPECIFISAGFDGHQRDPLANLRLVEEDYRFITRRVCEVADEFAKSRVISTLEGGYNLQVLGSSVLAHIEAML